MTWLQAAFAEAGAVGPLALVFISITLSAASMSTMDGMLVSLSAVIVNDTYAPFAGARPSDFSANVTLTRSRNGSRV